MRFIHVCKCYKNPNNQCIWTDIWTYLNLFELIWTYLNLFALMGSCVHLLCWCWCCCWCWCESESWQQTTANSQNWIIYLDICTYLNLWEKGRAECLVMELQLGSDPDVLTKRFRQKKPRMTQKDTAKNNEKHKHVVTACSQAWSMRFRQ